MDNSSSLDDERERTFAADQIDEHIWLGDIESSEDNQAHDQLNITHILSILDYEPVRQVEDRRIRKYIEALDISSMDLISQFDNCYQFIEAAVAQGSNVLIHCHAGMSRSATIACAYLMKKYNLSYDDAIERLRKKRPCVRPNGGFQKQLRNYQEILCETRIGENSTKIEYKCKLCRQILFSETDLVTHVTGKGRFDVQSRNSSYKAKQNAESKVNEICHQELFTDQPDWLTNIFDKDINDGDILCPNVKCQCKVGRYSLIGEKCSCAKWVNPAFHFHRSKIDECSTTRNIIEILLKRNVH